ncbi:hypothetical protein CR513_61319, partial [Mucuna pruriens]
MQCNNIFVAPQCRSAMLHHYCSHSGWVRLNSDGASKKDTSMTGCGGESGPIAPNRIKRLLHPDHQGDQQHLCPPMEANNFEVKPTLISMVQNSSQFGELSIDEPLAHLKEFFHFSNRVKINNVPTSIIYLRLFPFSITDKALSGSRSLPDGSITT